MSDTELALNLPSLPASNNPSMMKIVYGGFLALVEAEKSVLKWGQKLNIVDDASLREAEDVIRACRGAKKALDDLEKQAIEEPQAYVKQVKELRKNFGQVFDGIQEHGEALKVAYNLKKAREAREEQERIRAEQEKLRRQEEARKRELEEQETQRQLEEARKRKEQRDADSKKIAEANENDRLRLQLEAESKQREADALAEKQRAEIDAQNRKQEALDKADRELREQQLNNELAKASAKEKNKGVQLKWTYEIIDEKAVIRRYCEPSKGLILKAVNGGLRETLEDGTPDPSASGLRIYQEAHSVTRT